MLGCNQDVAVGATRMLLSQSQARAVPRSTIHSGSPPMCFSVTRAGGPPAKPLSAGAPHQLHGPYNSSNGGTTALLLLFLHPKSCMMPRAAIQAAFASQVGLARLEFVPGAPALRRCAAFQHTAGTCMCGRAAFLVPRNTFRSHQSLCLWAQRAQPSRLDKQFTIHQPCTCSGVQHGHVCPRGPSGCRCRRRRRRGC